MSAHKFLRGLHAVDKLEQELVKPGPVVLSKEDAKEILSRIKAVESTNESLLTSLIEKTGMGAVLERTGILQRRQKVLREG